MTSAQAPAPGRAPRPDVPRPQVAVPTVLLCLAMIALSSTSVWLELATDTPAWVPVPMQSFAIFAMFTVLHDAAHRGTGRVRWVSEALGRLGALYVLPYGSFPMFRWLHLAHHGHVNEGSDTDPDDWVVDAPTWQLPLRWPLVDARYLVFYVRRIRSRPAAELVETSVFFIGFCSLVGWLVASGYGWEAAVVYLIPQRITLAALAWWFDWLPHHGLEETNRGDRYRTTRNIVGMEWLLTPLLFSQNYHLLHHLHPIIPFYRYVEAWRQDEAGHLAQGPALATPTLREVTPEDHAAARGLTLTDA